MVKEKDSSSCWQHCATESPISNYKSASIELAPNESSPISPNHDTYLFSADVGSKTAHTSEAGYLLPWQSPSIQTFLHQASPSLPEMFNASFSKSCGKEYDENAVSVFVPKRFLIFDCSGNQTRLILDPPCYNRTQSPSPDAFMNPISSCEFHNKDLGAMTPKMSVMKPAAVEEIDENHIIGEESEMHEDTDEIDALLYSSDDDSGGGRHGDFSDDVIDDDEISTGRYSPLETNGEKKEAATSDARPFKKMKLLNNASFSPKTSGYGDDDDDDDDDVDEDDESRYRKCATGSNLGIKQSRKDKIREKLKILESLILGGMGKDPLLVLDEAIKYLLSEKGRH